VRNEFTEIARSADHAQTPAVYDKLIGSTRVYIAAETTAAEGGTLAMRLVVKQLINDFFIS
jgi:hypothetical protein